MEPATDLDLHDVERELCRLSDISAARIVADGGGRPVEVHILAIPGKPPKQIVRDVQSVALASFALELDRRIVSVVQLGTNGSSNGAQEVFVDDDLRARIVAITGEATGLRSLVRVTLERDGEEAVGFAEGSVAVSARCRLVATATLDALRQLEPAAECLDVDSAQMVRVGSSDVAVVTVVFVVPPAEELVSGSAVVRRQGNDDAVARAVLDATNRRLARETS